MQFSPNRFLNDDSGTTVIEYAFIATIVSIAIVTAMTAIGLQVNQMFLGVYSGFAGK